MADKQSGIQLETSNHVYERSDPEKDEEDDGCCRSCTNKLNRALENFFARFVSLMSTVFKSRLQANN